MAFEVRDYYDFVRLLYQHPEWQEELRDLLIAKEIRELPQVVRELAEAQKRTEQRVEELAEAQKRTDEQLQILTQRVDALTQRMDALTQRVDALTQRVDALTQRMEELAEAQKRTEQRLEELAEAQKRTEQRVEELAEAQKRTEQRVEELAEAQKRLEGRVEKLTTRMGEVSGYMLEARYRQRPLAYLNRLLTEARVVEVSEVIPVESDLTEDEWQELLALDVLVQGQLRPAFAEQLGVSEIWLAVEVSGLVEYSDVERAWERAALLKRCGLWPVVGVVSGREMTENAASAIDEGKKVLVELERRLINLESILTYLQAGVGHN